jgi:small subunit ribosomal protein S17
MTMEKQRHRQEIRGIVVSDKMAKTRVVEVKRSGKHGLYQKRLQLSTRFFVHDEKNESKVGDLVVAALVRPLSKNKNFRLVRIETKAAQ